MRGWFFPGKEKTTWTWDEEAKLFYYHRFYWHQPDLNTGNPAVRKEIEKIISCWVRLGVSGFRVDALPFIITTKGPGSTAFGDRPEYLIDMRQVLSWRRGMRSSWARRISHPTRCRCISARATAFTLSSTFS